MIQTKNLIVSLILLASLSQAQILPYEEVDSKKDLHIQQQTPPFQTQENTYQESTNQESSSTNPKHFLALYAHKPIYFLPFYHSITPPTSGNKDTETKFQFSFKIPISQELFSPYGTLYFAYTQTSWFQNYSKADSRPFRDIDYQPEFFYSYERKMPLFGGFLTHISLGVNHTSNGERALRSRTQNRLIMQLHWIYETKPLTFGVKLHTWVYISRKESYEHDNPDLEIYRGYDDILLYIQGGRHLFEFYIRPPLATRYYPYFELGYTFKISRHIGLYTQYVNGYGDNMYEYKIPSQRIGVGIRLWEF